MTLDDFDFDLPDDRIALRPVSPRSAARLMVLRGQQIEDAFVNRLPQLLRPGDMLVFNDTAVIPARLTGTRTRPTEHGSGVARIEVTLLEPDTQGVWHALARPAKRLAPGDVIEVSAELRAEVVAKGEAGAVHLRFNESGAAFEAALSAAGSMPLPPYIAAKRAADVRDKTDYQSVFARRPGAVAAPTASLHFDAALLQALEAAGISHAFVTLHVGAGTFLPVKVGDIDNHRMHAEWGQVSDAVADRIRAARAAGGRIIPVGTTALRLIETAARDTGEIAGWEGDTDIFIRPGFRFRATDGLMTNFHLPRSTLLMLVAALIGLETTHRAYAHAIANDYRFFSYGDASLLFPAEA